LKAPGSGFNSTIQIKRRKLRTNNELLKKLSMVNMSTVTYEGLIKKYAQTSPSDDEVSSF
jgi:hypothetical protein